MSVSLAEYKKKKDYLICVDSDGCAMDTMDIKHFRCFGPCMVEEWNLFKWENEILHRWNEINLYTITRGINRFKGLSIALREINDIYQKIEEIEVFEKWVAESKELSNGAIERELLTNKSVILEKALNWSKCVNEKINELPFELKKPYKGVKEALELAHKHADIAIVSSANLEAVIEEWTLYGLLEHVDIVMSQNVGSKAFCISEMLKKGYEKEHVIMIGDALGDYDAAMKNEILYYPILVRNENISWEKFCKNAIPKLLADTYSGEYQDEKVAQFLANLQ